MKICPICNKEYIEHRCDQRTCSNSCCHINYRRTHPKPRLDRYRLDNPKRDKVCPFCTIKFRDNSRQNMMKFCCNEHSNKYYHKNIFKPRYFESNKIICSICNKRFLPGMGVKYKMFICSRECMIKHLIKFKELGYILGVIASDGFLTSNNRQMGMTVKDKDYALAFQACLNKIFPSCNFKLLSHCDGRFRVYSTIKSINTAISYLFKGKTKTFDWIVPPVILENKQLVPSFLSGFFDGEATVNLNKKGGYVSIQCYSANEVGLKQLAKLLESLNIEYNLYRLKRKGGILHNRKLNKSYINNSDIYSIGINKFDNLKRFYELIGFKIERKQNKLVHFINTFKYRRVAWREKEDQLLKNKSLSNLEISKILNIKKCRVANRRKKLGLRWYYRKPMWNKKEEDIIRFSKLGNEELSKELNRTPQAIIMRRHILKHENY